MSTPGVDVVIVGGSYAGLAAALALGRARRRVVVIDSGLPCNRQTPRSHNFLTQDGTPPAEIAALARRQVKTYDTVRFVDGVAAGATMADRHFVIDTTAGESYVARKLIFASGIKDVMPELEGMAECWGISVLHCPYCHGYEARDQVTGILGNGDWGFEFSRLIANWTRHLTLYTNGPSTLAPEEAARLARNGTPIVEMPIARLLHHEGRLQHVAFADGAMQPIEAIYTRVPFQQHCPIPEALGCALTEQGYIEVDVQQATSVPGVFACGDNTTHIRTVANAVASGTTAGMMANKQLALEDF